MTSALSLLAKGFDSAKEALSGLSELPSDLLRAGKEKAKSLANALKTESPSREGSPTRTVSARKVSSDEVIKIEASVTKKLVVKMRTVVTKEKYLPKPPTREELELLDADEPISTRKEVSVTRKESAQREWDQDAWDKFAGVPCHYTTRGKLRQKDPKFWERDIERIEKVQKFSKEEKQHLISEAYKRSECCVPFAPSYGARKAAEHWTKEVNRFDEKCDTHTSKEDLIAKLNKNGFNLSLNASFQEIADAVLDRGFTLDIESSENCGGIVQLVNQRNKLAYKQRLALYHYYHLEQDVRKDEKALPTKPDKVLEFAATAVRKSSMVQEPQRLLKSKPIVPSFAGMMLI